MGKPEQWSGHLMESLTFVGATGSGDAEDDHPGVHAEVLHDDHQADSGRPARWTGSSSVSNELGREVPALVDDVVPSHGCEARQEFDGPEFVETFERISVLQVDDNFQASCAERDEKRSRRFALWRPIRKPREPLLGCGRKKKGTSLDDPLAPSARLRYQHRSKPRCPAVVAFVQPSLKGLWHCVGPQRQALGVGTPPRPMIADEHVASVRLECGVSHDKCATHVGTDTKKHLAGHRMPVCAAAAVLFFCLAAFDFIPELWSAVLWSEPVRAESHNRNAIGEDAQRARVMLVGNPFTLDRQATDQLALFA